MFNWFRYIASKSCTTHLVQWLYARPSTISCKPWTLARSSFQGMSNDVKDQWKQKMNNVSNVTYSTLPICLSVCSLCNVNKESKQRYAHYSINHCQNHYLFPYIPNPRLLSRYSYPDKCLLYFVDAVHNVYIHEWMNVYFPHFDCYILQLIFIRICDLINKQLPITIQPWSKIMTFIVWVGSKGKRGSGRRSYSYIQYTYTYKIMKSQNVFHTWCLTLLTSWKCIHYRTLFIKSCT